MQLRQSSPAADFSYLQLYLGQIINQYLLVFSRILLI